ncbi:uncharacterized protein SCHCODRAFT_02640414 [Schizophyllum commune H4-8]|uniref:uncharacterized protein n=1 Tax=Schizophyllum commune (strain H4-8 / FGSC 9210) TaxID=578458 RepID=UPI00216010E0|nr:uncharacterized protein SCHCODRAFT_02640414 [Schizophyllum commune H4-8]KAI5886970.1 hypothetical protein SCHCODRAFT_02640414 [Schizophyllum commune H4-8]
MVYAPLAAFGPPHLGDHEPRYARAPKMPESPAHSGRSLHDGEAYSGACMRPLSPVVGLWTIWGYYSACMLAGSPA